MCKRKGIYYNKEMYQFNENDGISITLTRKRMKNIRIRVTGEKRVCVSAPHFVTAARIDAFVQEHEAFIRKQLEEVERKRSAYYPLHYTDGDAFTCLGTRLRLKICVSQRHAATLTDDTLILYLPQVSDTDEAKALFAHWARLQAKRVFSQRLALLLPRFSGTAAMRLCVRDMLTRWGSINVKRHSVSLSVHLLRCETQLIDYVIMHELCHMAHPYHTKAFYAALEAHCPERRLRDRKLEAYGLVGF